MAGKIEYDEEYVARAEADASYWRSLAPPGYTLLGFTYRQSALFSYKSKHYEGLEHTINIEQAHVDFFNPDHREGADEEG